MQLSVLASGSKGNAIYVEAGSVAVLVDCGLTVPELKRRLRVVGRDTSRLSAVFVTHDHTDHTGSSATLAKRLGIPLYATAGTHSVLGSLPGELERVVRAGEPVRLEAFEILPFTTSHDGVEPVAFRVTERATGRVAGIATDLGYVSRQVVENLAGAHLLLVEHNHDERMLIDGPYPEMLKRRILGVRGHLSNEAGALLASQVLHPALKQVVLGHLSETNNTPDHARRAFEKENDSAPATLSLHVARQDAPSPVFEV